MALDSWGNEISAPAAGQARAIGGFTRGLLSYEQTLLSILDEADQDQAPNTLLQSYAAVLWLLSESALGAARANIYVERARRGLSGALPREAAFFAFTDAWVAGDLGEATARSDRLIEAWPRDLTAIKLRQYIDFNLGRFADLLRTGLIAQDSAPEVAYVHGMTAFGYEQCHLLTEAEGAAWQALALQANEPWAQHALAHVMLTEGRIDEGSEFLDSVSAQWEGLNSFIYTHLWWHQALFRLSQGRFDEALDIYDRHVWGIDKSYSQDQVGAISLLARLEFAGLDTGERWQDLGGYLSSRVSDVVEPFLSLQYLYGLQRAGRSEAKALLAAIEARAQAVAGPVAGAWRDCAVPLAKGLQALDDGSPVAALRHLRLGMPYLTSIGGSHAQRDLFEQIELKALIAAGLFAEAQQVLERRRQSDPYGVPVNRQLSLVYERLSLPGLAAQAQGRADQRIARREAPL